LNLQKHQGRVEEGMAFYIVLSSIAVCRFTIYVSMLVVKVT